MKACVILALGMLLSLGEPPVVWGQESKVITWSTEGCTSCESSISSPGWYSDGSGLFTEVMGSDTVVVVAAISEVSGKFVVTMGFQAAGAPVITINPSDSVTLETDSAPQMVLYPLSKLGREFPKGWVAVKRRFNGKALALTPGRPMSGYLFFPGDGAAEGIVLVARVGNETFRFPFYRDPNSPSRFVGRASHMGSAEPPEMAALQSSQSPLPDSRLPQQKQGAKELPGRPARQVPMRLITGQKPQSEASPTGCAKNVSFARVEDGQLLAATPDFVGKWVRKNKEKYSTLCFSQAPNPRAENYLLVFSRSAADFNGIYPRVRTTTSTTTTPVSGTGTAMDDYGDMWYYTYTGTVTSTTTTTTQENLPYTDTSTTLYLRAYDQDGRLVSKRWRTLTTRQGGDAANTVGYNLGSLLMAIHMRQRLLKDVVQDVTKATR